MYVTIVTYQPATGKSVEEILASSRVAAPMFRRVPGLIGKYLCFGDADFDGTSIYIWRDRGCADRFFSDPAFLRQFRESFGGEPEVTYVDPALVIDTIADLSLASGDQPPAASIESGANEPPESRRS